MTNIFKSIFQSGDKFELTTNPSILLKKSVKGSDIKLFGLKLYDDIDLINKDDIDTITLEIPPKGVNELYVESNGIFYKKDGLILEYKFEDRINAVITQGGCFQMKTGVTYVIDNRQIIAMRIYSSKHNFYTYIEKSNIEPVFGKADKVEERYFDEDDSLASTNYFFNERMFVVDFDDWSSKISSIFFGTLPIIFERDKKEA